MFNFKNDPDWSIFEPIKFLIAGSISSASSLLTIFVLVSGLGLWPVWGTIGASLISGTIGFTLHKIWTFKDQSPRWLKQAFFYFSITSLNLVVSALAMYILNDQLHIWYLLDQVIILAGLAIANYLIYRTFIFSKIARQAI
ncbi:MAG: GtrA family protein [Candidatus Paceibacterota bacterium]|jgi:putative flippase GtrA